MARRMKALLKFESEKTRSGSLGLRILLLVMGRANHNTDFQAAVASRCGKDESAKTEIYVSDWKLFLRFSECPARRQVAACGVVGLGRAMLCTSRCSVIYFYIVLSPMAVTGVTSRCEQLPTGPCDDDHRPFSCRGRKL